MLAIDWTAGLDKAWADVAAFVPKLVGAIVVFLIGWFIAKIIRSFIQKLLKSINFDSFVDRSGLGEPLANAGYKDSGKLLASLIYYAVMLIVLQLTINVFGNSDVSKAFDGLIAFLPRLFVALIIVVLTGVIANAVRGFIAPALSHNSAGDLLTKIAFGAIWFIGGFAAVDQLGLAPDVVNTLFQTLVVGLGLIFVISFGVGGIQAARDRFWPAVYDSFSGTKGDKS